MSKYVKSYTLKLAADDSFNELICDYPKYVDIEQDGEASISINLMDESGKKHHLNFTAHTEKIQQDGLTSDVFMLDTPFVSVSHEILQKEETVLVTLNTRLKAMWCCVWFGTMPYRVYEKTCHYRRGYLRHLRLNWGTVWMWLTNRRVSQSYAEFERETNLTWKHVFKNMFRGLW